MILAVELLSDTTVAGYKNMTAANDTIELGTSRGIYVSLLNEALYVCDSRNFRVQRFYLVALWELPWMEVSATHCAIS